MNHTFLHKFILMFIKYRTYFPLRPFLSVIMTEIFLSVTLSINIATICKVFYSSRQSAENGISVPSLKTVEQYKNIYMKNM
jgi:hypothetical protein